MSTVKKAKTKEEWQVAAQKAINTGRMANTLAKALAKRYAKRWRFVDFLGPNGRESAGVVDIVAIRKDGRVPAIEGLKRLDLFDIVLIQVKGGSAPRPSADDIERLKVVSDRYHAKAIVLFEWQAKKKAGFLKLDVNNGWVVSSTAELFT